MMGEAGKYMLVADSGATKCSWAFVGTDCNASSRGGAVRFETAGLNAAVNAGEAIRQVASECAAQLSLAAGPSCAFPEPWVGGMCPDGMFALEGVVGRVADIWIYAAGVTSPEAAALVDSVFVGVFPCARVHVASDMLGAARAACGAEAGIVGILGTGSNSCFYDGKRIVKQGLGGGYVLGDEGSGAWFGKRLLSDFIRDRLPQDMTEALREEYALDYRTIVENVYRADAPSRYLASFFPFILKWAKPGAEDVPEDRPVVSTSHLGDRNQTEKNEYAAGLIREGFGAFLDRCIVGRYDSRSYPLNLCGSVAWFCRDIIAECAASRGIALGRVVKSPIDSLVDYHSSLPCNADSVTR